MKLFPGLPFFGFALVCVSPASLDAANLSAWPTWRGTSGAGVAPSAQPPLQWIEGHNIKWKAKIPGAPYVPSPVLSGGRLYMSKSNDAYLSCLNALTGEVHYQDQALPKVRSIYASPLAANGHLYIVGREGTVMVIKDAPTFDVVATNTLSDRFDASPVMLEQELFLRGHEYLYCIAES